MKLSDLKFKVCSKQHVRPIMCFMAAEKGGKKKDIYYIN